MEQFKEVVVIIFGAAFAAWLLGFMIAFGSLIGTVLMFWMVAAAFHGFQ